MSKEHDERVELLSEEVTDLPVSEELAEHAKGGADTFSVNYAAIKFDYKPQK